MSTIGEIARITVKGAPSGDGDTTPERAWLLYTAAMEQAKRDGATVNDDGSVVWVGSMKQIAKGLWPEVNWEDKATSEVALRDVYSYFWNNQIARVIERNIDGVTQNRWLLAPSFEAKMTKQQVKGYRQTYTEARLSKHEAGEDRVPAPVTVTKPEKRPGKAKTAEGQEAQRVRGVALQERGDFACPDCDKHFDTMSALGGHRKAHRLASEKARTCPVCKVLFNSTSALNGHRKAHNPPKPKVTTTCVCGKVFPSAQAQQGHRRACTGTPAPTVLSDVALRKQQKLKADKAATNPAAPKAPAATIDLTAAAPSSVDVAVMQLVNALSAAASESESRLRAENAALKAQLDKIRSAFAVDTAV